MKKITAIVTVYLLTITTTSLAQNHVSKSVFASAGDVLKSGIYTVEWTIGETITGSNEASTNKVYQGFHPPLSNGTVSVHDLNDSALKVELFPNPVSENELLVRFKEWSGQAKLTIFDLQGKLLWQKEIPNIFNDTHTIDVSFLTDGNFLLSIQEGNKQPFVKKFSIIRH